MEWPAGFHYLRFRVSGLGLREEALISVPGQDSSDDAIDLPDEAQAHLFMERSTAFFQL